MTKDAPIIAIAMGESIKKLEYYRRRRKADERLSAIERYESEAVLFSIFSFG